MSPLHFPVDLHYLVEHDVWARDHGDGTVTVGITALGIQRSGELYMCRVKSHDALIDQGRSIAVVELAKAVVSVKSAVTGRIIATNEALAETPELVHRDPYGRGWLARLAWLAPERDRQRLLRGAEALAAFKKEADPLIRFGYSRAT